jgi:hypothetical protein
MRSFKLIFIVAVVLCFVSSLVFAQDFSRKGLCQADVEKFCKDVQPGQGRILQCMKQHEAELSIACKNHIAEAREKTQEFIKACKPDAQKFCNNVKPGKGRIYRCLKQHEAELSANCQDHVK